MLRICFATLKSQNQLIVHGSAPDLEVISDGTRPGPSYVPSASRVHDATLCPVPLSVPGTTQLGYGMSCTALAAPSIRTAYVPKHPLPCK